MKRGDPNDKAAAQQASSTSECVDTTVGTGSWKPDSEPVLASGDLAERYKVLGLLGRGGFGCVYACVDRQLDREVAVKVGRANAFDSQQQVEVFLAEARALSRLRHPGIVHVYDCGRCANGTPFVVMERVRGTPLDQAAKVRSPAQRAELILQAARAVAHAHQREIVHRDLKPANLLVDEQGQIRVLDFGLALRENQRWQHQGEYAGTPAYMAPEQIRCEAHRLDGRADIWALGVMLYELLCGQRPFRGQSRAEIEDEILHRPPKPPRQINDTAPMELEQICLKCLEKDPRDRFSTAADLAVQLSRAIGTPSALSRRGVGLVVCAAGLLLTLMMGWYAVVGWKPDTNFPPRSGSPGQLTAAAPVGSVDWGVDVHLNGSSEASVPAAEQTVAVINGDAVRIWAKFSAARYAVVAWLDSAGQAQVIYPPAGAEVQPVREISLPYRDRDGFPIIGAPGVELALLLTSSRDPIAVTGLAASLAPTRPFAPIGRRVIVDGNPLINERFREDLQSLAMSRLRGIEAQPQPLAADQSLLQLSAWREQLATELPRGVEIRYLALPHVR